MNNRLILAFALALGLMFATRLPAQAPADTSGLYEMSLEQLQQLKAHGVSSETEVLINSLIFSASNKPYSSRETPNVVTIITAEEIKRSGARDLVDVLRLVPGLVAGQDVENVVSIGVRGLWAAEGKFLVLVDGFEMNEMLYGFFPLGMEFPLERIVRIEVIRGPGSIVNGGSAEYAVINITTDAFESGKIAEVDALGGVTSRGVTTVGGGAQVWLHKNEITSSFRASMQSSNRSDRTYTDAFGNSFDMLKNSRLQSQQAVFQLKYKTLTLNYGYSFYESLTNAPFDTAYPQLSSYTNRFTSQQVGLKYNLKIGKRWKIDPFVSVVCQRPWQTPVFAGLNEYSNQVIRARGRVQAQYRIKRKMTLSFGAEYFQDHARALIDSLPFNSGDTKYVFHNIGGFAEFSWKTRFVNIVTGLRYDYNSGFGNALVPRVALTKRFGNFNYKLLYNESFKAPSIANVDGQTSSGMRAELTRGFEAELGYQFGKKMFLSGNVFQLNTRRPIVYFFDDSLGIDQYVNKIASGTRGAEFELNYRDSLLSIRASYSYYTSKGIENYETSLIPDNDNMLLALPQHKVALTATFLLPGKIYFNISGQFMSERYGYTAIDSVGERTLTEFAPEFMLNTFISRDNIFPGFDLGIGCSNILNINSPYIQPYQDYLAPMPGMSREFTIRLRYTIPAKTSIQ